MKSSVTGAKAAVVFLSAMLVATVAYAADKHRRDAAAVLSAFRPIVAEAGKSTVRVLAEGKRVALGTVVEADGWIVTKASELKSFVDLECQLSDGRRLPAKAIGVDKERDLAMLKLEASDLTAVVWSEANDLPVGSVVATTGLQKDPIAIGVIGVAARHIPRSRGALGVVLADIAGGVFIERLVENGAAARAGIEPRDQILAVDSVACRDSAAAKELIGSREPDASVKLHIKRGDKTMDIDVVLGSFNAMMAGDRAEFQNQLGSELSKRRHGFPMVLQHDCVLNAEVCGGPLVGLDGKVVGINIARAGRVETYALPASIVRPALEDLKAGRNPPPKPEPAAP